MYEAEPEDEQMKEDEDTDKSILDSVFFCFVFITLLYCWHSLHSSITFVDHPISNGIS